MSVLKIHLDRCAVLLFKLPFIEIISSMFFHHRKFLIILMEKKSVK